VAIKGGIALGLKLGNLGFKIRGITEVDNSKGYFSEIFAKHKAIGFIGLSPTVEQHAELLKTLYAGDTSQELNPLVTEGQNHSTIANVENWTNRDYFIHQNWHLDHSFFDYTTSLLSMHMTTFTCPKERGQTHLASLIDLYGSLPGSIQEQLQTAEFECWTGSEGLSGTRHPALRTHPVTGETSLYWSGGDTRLVGEDTGWFQKLKEHIDTYLLDRSNWWSWEWSEGDVLVWDNRCLIHSFSPGWNRGQRVFNRGHIGAERPFYDSSFCPELNPDFGDTNIFKGVERDTSSGPNPDHIPLVFTHGIYGLPGLEHLYQKVTVVVTTHMVTDSFNRFTQVFQDDEEFAVEVITEDRPELYRHLHRYADRFFNEPLNSDHILVVSKNGDVLGGLRLSDDLLTNERVDPETSTPMEFIKGLLSIHPDMRHAGHSWHYPDWFKHQPLQERPWSYRNLSFFKYNQEPTEDFLVQFAIDTVYGCFNHLENDEDRKRVIERIHDYISYMLDLGEYKHDR